MIFMKFLGELTFLYPPWLTFRAPCQPLGVMTRKDSIDLFGAIALIGFALNLSFNQVVIKVTSDGFAPVFAVALRSVGAALVLYLWMRLRGVPRRIPRAAWLGAGLSGLLFTVEFICLFIALDLTTVSRVSVIFYSMPVWLALAAHVLLPGEQLGGRRLVGFGLAMGGVVLAMMDRGGGQASWAGDLMALGAALCWAGIALLVRITPLAKTTPEQQIFWQVAIAAPALMLLSPLFGPLVRVLEPIHYVSMIYQILAVSSFGFLFWFWLMSIYPASSVASFSFLSPVFAVLLGWLILSEVVAPSIWGALALVAAGIWLINRRAA